MNHILQSIRSRLLLGIQLSDDEHATVEAVLKRMRTAIRRGRGIRLSRDELRALGLYGLKQQLDDSEPGVNQL